jgi:hypothetical protein
MSLSRTGTRAASWRANEGGSVTFHRMVRFSSVVGATAVLIGCAHSGNSEVGAVDEADRQWLATAARARETQSQLCRTGKLTITRLHGLSEQDACTLTMVALDEIRMGRATALGVQPGDTARVTASLVSAFLFTPLDTSAPTAYWAVELTISGRPGPVDVRIDRRTRQVVVREGETGRRSE